MRRIFFWGLMLAMSASLMTSCTYQEWEPQSSDNTSAGDGTVVPGTEKNVPFEIKAQITATKTVNEEGTLAWSVGDALNVYKTVSGATSFSDAGKVEFDKDDTFKGILAEGLDKGYTYDWFMFYPYTEGLSISENNAGVVIGSQVGAAQTQSGYGNKDHVAGKSMPLFGYSMGVKAEDTPSATMQHLAGIIEINVTNGVTPPLTVNEVVFSAGEEIIGTFNIDFASDTPAYQAVNAGSTAKLAVSGGTELAKDETASFYLLVKPFTVLPASGIKVSVNGYEKQLDLTEVKEVAAGQTQTFDFVYDKIYFDESLAGAYQIKGLWVYGGTGPEYGGAGFVDMHNKSGLFDEEAGHGITAEMDNYLEFTFIDLIDNDSKTTGKCVNWAGADGKNWSCWYKQSDVPWNKADISHFYRQIPIGESTWVRDYSVTPNTVTFTDSEGNTTILEILPPQEANGHTFENETFHTVLNGSDNWNAIYNDIDKVYYKPRNYYIEVAKVDSVPEDSKTIEAPFVPTLPPDPSIVPESIAGKYVYANAYCFGGIDPAFVGFVEKSWAFNDTVWNMQDDQYVFTATGKDADGNETGEIEFIGGDNGYWDCIMPRTDGDVDASEFYTPIAQGKSKYVYNKTAGTVTFISDDKTATARFLVPGSHDFSGKSHEVIASMALDFNLNYTEPTVPGYAQDWTDFERFYVAPHNYVLHLNKVD